MNPRNRANIAAPRAHTKPPGNVPKGIGRRPVELRYHRIFSSGVALEAHAALRPEPTWTVGDGGVPYADFGRGRSSVARTHATSLRANQHRRGTAAGGALTRLGRR